MIFQLSWFIVQPTACVSSLSHSDTNIVHIQCILTFGESCTWHDFFLYTFVAFSKFFGYLFQYTLYLAFPTASVKKFYKTHHLRR